MLFLYLIFRLSNIISTLVLFRRGQAEVGLQAVRHGQQWCDRPQGDGRHHRDSGLHRGSQTRSLQRIFIGNGTFRTIFCRKKIPSVKKSCLHTFFPNVYLDRQQERGLFYYFLLFFLYKWLNRLKYFTIATLI
jgi:hypothetical protein